MKEVFLLLVDMDGTLRSMPHPFGVAVTTEEEAKRFVEEGTEGFSRSYQKITIFDNQEESVQWAFQNKKI